MAHNNYVFHAVYSENIMDIPLECPCRCKCLEKGSLVTEECEVKGLTNLQTPLFLTPSNSWQCSTKHSINLVPY